MAIRTLLVANRGEIAVRIFRTCRRLGIRTVAVVAPDDTGSLHARSADEVVAIESYLSAEEHIRAARESGADAVHPGYGFLAESPDFAEAVETAGLVFVGPSADALRQGGDKLAAKEMAQAAGVPVVPEGDPAEIGFPLVVKAAAGGGGRGMRVVRDPAELDDALAAARREAQGAFGDDRVFCERYVERPRHVEIQLLADGAGTVASLGERECSIQRRHQKVIEEAPSSFVDPAMRTRLGEAACRIAKAAGYVNAGTVEFLVDADRNFYFLEMNTRLQVEHPVTEMVTGIDLVREQLRIAAGEPVGFAQADVTVRGAAIECRINAEDPFGGWMPSPGKITGLRAATGPWVRDDSGAYEGYTVPRYYDTLLAKLIVWGADRPAAIQRMARALSEYRVVGILTTIPVLAQIVVHEDFRAGRLSTGFLDRVLPTFAAERDRARSIAVIAAVLAEYERRGRRTIVEAPPPSADDWRTGRHPGWRS